MPTVEFTFGVHGGPAEGHIQVNFGEPQVLSDIVAAWIGPGGTPINLTSFGLPANGGTPTERYKVIIGEGILSISTGAFEDHKWIKELVIETDQTINIADFAFAGVQPLSKITINSNISSIGNGVFMGTLPTTSPTFSSIKFNGTVAIL